MARVEYDRAGIPRRIILGRKSEEADLYVVFPVVGQEGDFSVGPATVAFLGDHTRVIPVWTIDDIELMKQRATQALTESMSPAPTAGTSSAADSGVHILDEAGSP